MPHRRQRARSARWLGGLTAEEAGADEPDPEAQRNPIKNDVVITEKVQPQPQLKTDQDTGFKRQVSQLFG